MTGLFTLDRIRMRNQLGRQATLPQYLQALKAIGVDSMWCPRLRGVAISDSLQLP